MWFGLIEPSRTHAQEKAAAEAPPMTEVLTFVGRSPQIALTIAGLTIATMSSASIWVWTTPVLVRQHAMTLTEAGLIVGTAAGLMKFISTAGAGFLADWLARGRVDRLWIVPSFALALSAPVCIAMGLMDSKSIVIGLVWTLGLTMGAIIPSQSDDRLGDAVTHARCGRSNTGVDDQSDRRRLWSASDRIHLRFPRRQGFGRPCAGRSGQHERGSGRMLLAGLKMDRADHGRSRAGA